MGAMYKSAKDLVDNSGGLFCAYQPGSEGLIWDVDSTEETHHRIIGKPIESVDDADVLGSMFDSRYAGLPASVEEYNRETGAIDRIGDYLERGQNVALGLEHGELVDVALEEEAVSNALRRRGIGHRSALIVSKSIDFMGVNLSQFGIPNEDLQEYFDSIGADIPIRNDNTIPLRGLLAVAVDLVYLTIPSSNTFSNIRDEQGGVVRDFNRRVRNSINEDMSNENESPLLLGVAVPGTTVKLLDQDALDDAHPYKQHQRQVEVIGYISPAIISFLKGAVTFATAIRLGESPPKICISEHPLNLETEKDIDSLGRELVSISRKLNPEVTYICDQERSLPVNRK